MAPAMMESLVKRYTYDCDGFGNCYQNSNWDNWGRWVALAVIVVVALLIAFVFSYLSNRRRRRRGMAPMYGTGWMPGNPKTGQHYTNQQPGYYGQNQQYAPPPPPYVGSQATGTTFNSNDGYYGHHGQQGYEMQPPQQSYQPQRGGENVYDAPAGPPPGKTADGIIR